MTRSLLCQGSRGHRVVASAATLWQATNPTQPNPSEPQAAVGRLAAYATASYDYVEDHIRPVV